MSSQTSYTLLAGAAKRDITPAVGTPLTGFIARLGVSTDVAGRLYTRALIASSPLGAVAIIQLDLLGLPVWHVQQIRQACRRRFGIPPEQVLLHSTHTHSGPGVVPLRGCMIADQQYQWSVVDKTIDALQDAWDNRSAAKVATAKIPYQFGYNRRQETSDGVVLGVAPEKNCPQHLDVVTFDCANGNVHYLFSHAAHPYVLGGESTLISGDFPSFACEVLEQQATTVALFLNGCAGDIAPQGAFEGVESARLAGQRMAEAVLDACSSQCEIDPEYVCGDSILVALPHAELPSLENVQEMIRAQERTVRPEERLNQEVAKKIEAAYAEWARVISQVIRHEIPFDPVMAEVQSLRLGDLMLIGISGEPFYDIGQKIIRQSSAPHTIVLGYCNAYSGYLPTEEEFPGGGYEVNESFRYLSTWKIDSHSESRVIRAAQELCRASEEA